MIWAFEFGNFQSPFNTEGSSAKDRLDRADNRERAFVHNTKAETRENDNLFFHLHL